MKINKENGSAIGVGEVRRFGRLRIIEHWVLLILFLLLSLSGFAQYWNSFAISQKIIALVGGEAVIRNAHFTFGILFTALLAVHLSVAIFGVLNKKWLPAMLVSGRDFLNMVQDLRYYLGIDDKPAKFDRFDYKQKFVYWAVALSGILMAISGAILYFPVLSLKIIPAAAIPLAKILHNGVALLFLVIAFWHIYESVFSPGSFPLDASIFTGTMPIERMEREHPLELQRIKEFFASSEGIMEEKCKKEL